MRNLLLGFVFLSVFSVAGADEPAQAPEAAGLCPGGVFVTWGSGTSICSAPISAFPSSMGIVGRANDNVQPVVGTAEFRCNVLNQTWVEAFGFCLRVPEP